MSGLLLSATKPDSAYTLPNTPAVAALENPADANALAILIATSLVLKSEDELELLESEEEESEELDALLGIESADSFSHTILTYDGSEAEVDISIRATVVEREETVIPYETVEVYNDQRVESYERVLEEGEEGLSVTDYEAVYVDGELQTRSVLSVRTVEKPVDRQVEYGTIVKTSTFSWPYEGRISSYFGSRTLGGDYNYHNGLDIVAYSGSCYGDPIRAAGDGVVTVARYYDAGGYGKYVVIRHADGTETYYAHMSTVLVNVGDRVQEGDVIGKIGSTGLSTGPHLHFGVMVNGRLVDPLPYLS